jgi:hypothetical protein
VIRPKRELDGTVKGRANSNSPLDTRAYEIEFPDDHSDDYTASVIAGNMYAQYYEEGNHYSLVESILDHTTNLVGTCALNGNTEQQAGNT